jgi:hypothetical protein
MLDRCSRVLCCRSCTRCQRWHVLHRHTPPTPYVAQAATPTPYNQALTPRVVVRTVASAVRAMTCNSCDSSLLRVAKYSPCILTYPIVFTHFIYVAQPLLNVLANVGSSASATTPSLTVRDVQETRSRVTIG